MMWLQKQRKLQQNNRYYVSHTNKFILILTISTKKTGAYCHDQKQSYLLILSILNGSMLFFAVCYGSHDTSQQSGQIRVFQSDLASNSEFSVL